MKKALFFQVLILLSIKSVSQQQTHGIYFPQNDRQAKCNYFIEAFKQKPKEVKFGIKTDGNNLYFEISDKKWFNSVFNSTGDGIAVDIISKKRYDCNVSVNPVQIRGELLAPVYAMLLKKKLKKTLDNNYSVILGKIPESLKEEELEFNILFLHNKTFCKYYNIYNLQSYPWDILDMGVFLDTLTYKNQKISTTSENTLTKYKTLKFAIPFEKDKSEYKPEDIKPMYDSLRLTNFTIKEIDIKAYASVEGSVERNITLQKQRATSIANSLQSFQKPNIKTTLSSSENWVEFFNDLRNTKYATLATLSKDEIKGKLIGNYAKELEPVLKKHRKALVKLSLEKKDTYKKLETAMLITLFNKAIVEDNLKEASIIQNAIFKKVRKNLSLHELEQLKIPKQKKYIKLLTKNSIIKYVIDITQMLIVHNELVALKTLDPKNKDIQYNLMVLKFMLWKNRTKVVKRAEFKKEILALKNFGISQRLVDKMLVNFHILKAQENLQERAYDDKDESVEFITDTYENILLSDFDYLSLAQFLTYYSKYYDAIDLLENKVKTITVDEDLLFYYLNLTLTNTEFTKSINYKTTLLNAINMNKERFCKIFDPSLKGGVTFQLLENIDLRVIYCENCSK